MDITKCATANFQQMLHSAVELTNHFSKVAPYFAFKVNVLIFDYSNSRNTQRILRTMGNGSILLNILLLVVHILSLRMLQQSGFSQTFFDNVYFNTIFICFCIEAIIFLFLLNIICIVLSLKILNSF